MGIQFAWQAGDEGSRWETIAKVERKALPGIHGRIWKTFLVALFVFAAGGTLAVRYRYQLALRRITSAIQATIDVEARALERHDLDLYLAQQDETAPAWRGRQALYFSTYDAPDDLGRSPAALGASAGAREQACDSVEPVGGPLVQDVEMRGDVAWVTVVEGPCPALRARFYRQTRYGWKRTAPRPEFWRDPVELQYGSVTIRTGLRDEAYVKLLAEHITSIVEDVSAKLGLEESPKLEVDFIPDPPDQMPTLQGGRLIVASPWLTGISLQGTWEAEYLDKIEYWTAYWVASQFVQPASASRNKALSLSLLHRALVDEYAVLYSRGDPAQTPLLSAVIERRGLDALPEILASLRDTVRKSAFIADWLEAPPAHADAYFDTLENLGRQALRAGREDSLELVARVLFGEHTERMDQRRAEWIDRLRAEWVNSG
jgi:hypothetical protein